MDISKGKVDSEFQNWGKLYTVEFDIMVRFGVIPGSGLTNVFHFSAINDKEDPTPALWIHPDGVFYICSNVDGGKNCQSISFDFETPYQITIKQFNADGKYWYEIIVNGVSKYKVENTQPRSLPSVKFYTSHPEWPNSFSSEDMGVICNVKIQQNGGQIFMISYIVGPYT